jgi:hypothetical protein
VVIRVKEARVFCLSRRVTGGNEADFQAPRGPPMHNVDSPILLPERSELDAKWGSELDAI